MEALRSNVWSSETLLQGMTDVQGQPKGLLVKQETDPELFHEYNVSRLGWITVKFVFFFWKMLGIIETW